MKPAEVQNWFGLYILALVFFFISNVLLFLNGWDLWIEKGGRVVMIVGIWFTVALTLALILRKIFLAGRNSR